MTTEVKRKMKGLTNLKKIIAAFITLLVVCIYVGYADSSFSTDLISIHLPDEWYDMSSIVTNGNTTFMKLDGTVLIISASNLLTGLDDSEYAMYESIIDMMNDDMKYSLLEEEVKSILGTQSDSVEIKKVDIADGIISCYCKTEIDGAPCALAKVLVDKEEWTILCANEDTSIETEPILFDALQRIAIQDDQQMTRIDVDKPIEQGDNTVSFDGYTIPEVPMIVHVSEDDMNVFTLDSPADSESYLRSGFSKERMDAGLEMLGASIFITPKDKSDLDYDIQIRVKDDKYTGLKSWAEASDEEIDALLIMMFADKLINYQLYRTKTGVFADLKLTIDTNAIRYATIQNGDMIYIHGNKDSGPLNDDEIDLFMNVVNSVEFVQ